jgi:hypothetical protein
MGMGDLAFHQRTVLRAIQRAGFESEYVLAQTVLVHPYPTDQARYEAWYLDALACGLAAVAKDDWRVAFRAYAQCREYRGRLNGLHPWGLGDTEHALKRALEDRIQPLS